MKAHWSDVLFSWSKRPAIMSDGRHRISIIKYTKALADTELLLYNPKLVHRKNLERLEVGQGFYNNDGIQYANNRKMYPKEFKTYRDKLIVRVK
jgi:hypothetical protein